MLMSAIRRLSEILNFAESTSVMLDDGRCESKLFVPIF